jgi:flagellar motor switch protein FliM
VYDKFVSLISTELTSNLQRNIEVAIVSKEIVKFGEFLKAFSNPTGFSIFGMEPLIGAALLAIEPNLVFSMIDCMFGGEGKPLEKIREFTLIENRMLKRFSQDLLKNLEKAWEVAYSIKINLKKSETKPEFVYLVNPNDLLIIVVFSISGGTFSGNVHLATPYLMLEPIKDKLSSTYLREKEMAHSFGDQLKRLLKVTDVRIVAELGKATYTVGEILNFEIDDIIKLNSGPQDAVILMVENVPKYLGTPGIVKGNRALQIQSRIDQDGR